MQIKLDFNLNGPTARLEYLEQYLKDVDPNRLTSDNLEMMSNYVLWGLQSENPDLDFEIESKNSPWSKTSKTTSLEALMEQEQETGMPVQCQVSDVALATQKRKLDRGEVIGKLKHRDSQDIIRQIAIEMFKEPTARLGVIKQQFEPVDLTKWNSLTDSWFNLWSQIDMTEFMVQTWELAHGKRRIDLPIRDELHIRLACLLAWKDRDISLADFESELQVQSQSWEGYLYLKKKRALVQMRTQQYSLLDCLQGETLLRHFNSGSYWQEEEHGLREFYPFSLPEFLIDGATPEHFTPQFHEKCVKALSFLDRLEENPKLRDPYSIDFREADSVRQMILMYPDLKEAATRMSDVQGAVLQNLIRYLSYYISQCNFDPELEVILRAKMHKVSNKDIVTRLKEEFNLDYKENYISTIFTKRIVEAIVEQVNLHYRLIEFITMGNTVFKKCTKCGKLLPRNATYFNRRTSTSDGFFSSCKKCKTRRKD